MFDKNVFWFIKVSLDLNTTRGPKWGILTLQGATITPITFTWEPNPLGVANNYWLKTSFV